MESARNSLADVVKKNRTHGDSLPREPVQLELKAQHPCISLSEVSAEMPAPTTYDVVGLHRCPTYPIARTRESRHTGLICQILKL